MANRAVKDKRAITLDDHSRIVAREKNAEHNAFYQLCRREFKRRILCEFKGRTLEGVISQDFRPGILRWGGRVSYDPHSQRRRHALARFAGPA